MSLVSRIVRLGVLLAVFTLLMCGAAYLTLTQYISIRNVTCFGLFGNNKPFVEMQQAKEVAYVFSSSSLVYEKRTAYQFVEVYSHPYFGNILVIDGALQITQRDEVNYHEMTVHVPMAYLLPTARRALIIGGGDGGALYRLLQYRSLSRVDLVDIDLATIKEVTQRYFPELSGGFMDPRTHQHMYDGNLWVDEQRQARDEDPSYQPIDFIIIDSTDYGSAETLFTDAFYGRLKGLMSDNSILVVNLDSPSWNTHIVAMVQQQLAAQFKYAYVYQSHQPTFLSGHYSYLFLSDSVHPMKTSVDWTSWEGLRLNCHYYNPEVHYGSFFLPEDVRKRLTMSAQLRDIPAGGFFPNSLPQTGVPKRIDLPEERSKRVAQEAAESNEAEAAAAEADSPSRASYEEEL